MDFDTGDAPDNHGCHLRESYENGLSPAKQQEPGLSVIRSSSSLCTTEIVGDLFHEFQLSSSPGTPTRGDRCSSPGLTSALLEGYGSVEELLVASDLFSPAGSPHAQTWEFHELMLGVYRPYDPDTVDKQSEAINIVHTTVGILAQSMGADCGGISKALSHGKPSSPKYSLPMVAPPPNTTGGQPVTALEGRDSGGEPQLLTAPSGVGNYDNRRENEGAHTLPHQLHGELSCGPRASHNNQVESQAVTVVSTPVDEFSTQDRMTHMKVSAPNAPFHDRDWSDRTEPTWIEIDQESSGAGDAAAQVLVNKSDEIAPLDGSTDPAFRSHAHSTSRSPFYMNGYNMSGKLETSTYENMNFFKQPQGEMQAHGCSVYSGEQAQGLPTEPCFPAYPHSTRPGYPQMVADEPRQFSNGPEFSDNKHTDGAWGGAEGMIITSSKVLMPGRSGESASLGAAARNVPESSYQQHTYSMHAPHRPWREHAPSERGYPGWYGGIPSARVICSGSMHPAQRRQPFSSFNMQEQDPRNLEYSDYASTQTFEFASLERPAQKPYERPKMPKQRNETPQSRPYDYWQQWRQQLQDGTRKSKRRAH